MCILVDTFAISLLECLLSLARSALRAFWRWTRWTGGCHRGQKLRLCFCWMTFLMLQPVRRTRMGPEYNEPRVSSLFLMLRDDVRGEREIDFITLPETVL